MSTHDEVFVCHKHVEVSLVQRLLLMGQQKMVAGGVVWVDPATVWDDEDVDDNVDDHDGDAAGRM